MRREDGRTWPTRRREKTKGEEKEIGEGGEGRKEKRGKRKGRKREREREKVKRYAQNSGEELLRDTATGLAFSTPTVTGGVATGNPFVFSTK